MFNDSSRRETARAVSWLLEGAAAAVDAADASLLAFFFELLEEDSALPLPPPLPEATAAELLKLSLDIMLMNVPAFSRAACTADITIVGYRSDSNTSEELSNSPAEVHEEEHK